MTDKVTKFAKGTNRGTKVCEFCGKRTWESRIDWSTGLCEQCYEDAGYENAHSDGHHDNEPDMNCPVCREERDTAHVKE